jgi:protein-tyrosine kinase
MGLIEQAAKRLEELKNAGVELPFDAVDRRTGGGSVAKVIDRMATAEPSPLATQPSVAVPSDPKQDQRVSETIEIDLARLRTLGYLVPDQPRSQLADEFRVIKRPLLTNVQGKSAAPVERANLIMVTSSLPGEGKTFVSVNLALSIALELDTRVLLVETDSSRPATMARLGVPAARGLLDLLADPELPVSDVLRRTNIDRLSVLPIGTLSDQATEMLASGAMQRLLAEMSERYSDRVVIFDAPPLLPTPEARALAEHMGQIVMVVESANTAQGTVAQALDMLEKCPVVMTVLNKARGVHAGSNFAYYAY